MYQASTSPVKPSDLTKNLSRFVFDDLFEKDLLGFLLSSHHFHQHLHRMVRNADSVTAQQISTIVNNPIEAQEFHATMLEMYSGVHIEECKHRVHADLMTDLNEKYRLSLGPDDGSVGMFADELNRVELAWLYRRTCNGGKSIISTK